MNLKFAFVFILALVAFQLCTGQNNTEGQTDDGTTSTNSDTEEKSALEKGMDPIYDLYHNFLDTVMSKSFYDSDTPFNVRDLIEVIDKADYGRLQSEWQDLVKTFGGYAGCIIVGLIFVFFMPIVGLIYCCCHCCCHKCGGTQEMMDPKRAVCKRWTYTIILLICSAFMLAGGIITFLGSDLLHKSLKNTDQEGLVGKMSDSLGHLQTFTNNTLNDIKVIASEKIIEEGLEKILPEIQDAAIKTVEKVKKTINATDLLHEASDLGLAATTALRDLKTLEGQLNSLNQLQTDISEKLNNIKNDLPGPCPNGTACANVKRLNFNPNFTGLSALTGKADNVAKAVNISSFVEVATKEFDRVSKEVNDSLFNSIKESDAQVSALTTTIKKEIEQFSGLADPFVDSIKEGQDFFKTGQESFSDIADYIWYSCIGMGCAVLLVVFFYLLGVLYGLCGERPGPRAACCNRETGAHILCTGICCSFLFAWLLMLVVILLFTLGGLSYSMACKYISDGVEHVNVFESVLSDGFNWNVSKSFKVQGLTIAGMFEDCKANMGIYSALRLKYVFDIDKEFNLSDVKEEVRKMETAQNFNIPRIELMSDDLKNQLNYFKDASLTDINFTEYTEQLNKQLFGSQGLDEIIKDLKDAAAKTSSPASDDLKKAATDLENLRDNEINEVQKDMANLTIAVSSLQQKAQESLPEKINSMIANIYNSENTFNDQKENITKKELSQAVVDILTIIENTVNSTKDCIKNKVGRCRPLYDAAQSVVDAVCVVTLDPLNAIWFGLGWSLFFYIPSFIFAALLANLYKRSEKYRKKDAGFDDPIHAQYTGGNNGYHGGRHEDNVPLTSMGKDQRYSANGAYNHGYQGREFEHEPRYHRDEHSGYPPDNYSRDRGVPRGGGEHHYAKPHADPYDQPPRYDDAVLNHYERGSRHGGYPRLSNY